MHMQLAKHILSLSGGKDSTWLLHELVRRGSPIDEAVFFDTGWEYPQMYQHLYELKVFCMRSGIKFVKLDPPIDFDFLMFDKPVQERSGKTHNGYSWCGLCGCRWGTTEKLKALDKYCGKDNIVYVGIAADEPERLVKERKLNKLFPLAEWGITESDCLQRCYDMGYTWGGLYELLDRVSCKYCSLKNLKELRNVYFEMPSIWEELRQYQARTSRPYKGEGKSVFQLEKRFTFEKERQADGLSITNKDFYRQLSGLLKE